MMIKGLLIGMLACTALVGCTSDDVVNNNENKERNPTTDKRLSDMVGVSESTYRKLDKVMKSDNEEVKQQLREKKISIDKSL